jgi:hypothetical protein
VHVDEVVRSSVEETLNRLLDAEADLPGAALRALTRACRYARRSLGAQARDKDRRSDAEGAEAATAAVRDGNYRALPPARAGQSNPTGRVRPGPAGRSN